jgi:hypothetical protein
MRVPSQQLAFECVTLLTTHRRDVKRIIPSGPVRAFSDAKSHQCWDAGSRREEVNMTTIPHEPSSLVKRSVWLDARYLWASLTIGVIWLAVLFVGVFGPDFVGHSNEGNSSTIPSGIFVAFFALFATMSSAKYGFSKRTSDSQARGTRLPFSRQATGADPSARCASSAGAAIRDAAPRSRRRPALRA